MNIRQLRRKLTKAQRETLAKGGVLITRDIRFSYPKIRAGDVLCHDIEVIAALEKVAFRPDVVKEAFEKRKAAKPLHARFVLMYRYRSTEWGFASNDAGCYPPNVARQQFYHQNIAQFDSEAEAWEWAALKGEIGSDAFGDFCRVDPAPEWLALRRKNAKR